MAKRTPKTDPTGAPITPAARRNKAAAPAAGAEPVPTPGLPAWQGSMGQPTHDEIALRAWSIYLKRGASHGQAMSDWLEAKRQLYAERKLAE